jgi:hypothetical protein
VALTLVSANSVQTASTLHRLFRAGSFSQFHAHTACHQVHFQVAQAVAALFPPQPEQGLQKQGELGEQSQQAKERHKLQQ